MAGALSDLVRAASADPLTSIFVLTAFTSLLLYKLYQAHVRLGRKAD